ncbi:hypothetical protein ZIOFF_026396 [Zingiber officinale]|uniref:Uncharacterized protein n=1 Tax=Zingiber officinale TaxID=94328 RepID=A0A8J5GXD0_ZINOF|nr:hypothetical protein ZIOFF_026396 [Zingiber officinale]
MVLTADSANTKSASSGQIVANKKAHMAKFLSIQSPDAGEHATASPSSRCVRRHFTVQPTQIVSSLDAINVVTAGVIAYDPDTFNRGLLDHRSSSLDCHRPTPKVHLMSMIGGSIEPSSRWSIARCCTLAAATRSSTPVGSLPLGMVLDLFAWFDVKLSACNWMMNWG